MNNQVAARRAAQKRQLAALNAGVVISEISEAEAAVDEFDDETCRVAHVMARLLACDEEISGALGISVDEFNGLRQRHIKLS